MSTEGRRFRAAIVPNGRVWFILGNAQTRITRDSRVSMRTSLQLAASVPVTGDQRSRITMTASCRDCDTIPKVANAGDVLFESGVRVQIMHNGLRVVAGGYYGDWMMEIIQRLQGHHEPQEELLFHTLLSLVGEQATMIEIGGFWSYYSMWFIQNFAWRRAIVLEPDPNHLEIGKNNTALNRLKVDFVPAFIGLDNRPEVPFKTESSGTILIRMINVADFIEERNIDILDLLHCDAQGAEIDLLMSCETLFKRGRIRFLVLSTHAEAITGDPLTHQRCLDCVQEFGGQVLAEHDVHESFSGDGLIVAHFGRQHINWVKPAMSYNRYSQSFFRNPAFDLALARAEVDALCEKLARLQADRNLAI